MGIRQWLLHWRLLSFSLQMGDSLCAIYWLMPKSCIFFTLECKRTIILTNDTFPSPSWTSEWKVCRGPTPSPGAGRLLTYGPLSLPLRFYHCARSQTSDPIFNLLQRITGPLGEVCPLLQPPTPASRTPGFLNPHIHWTAYQTLTNRFMYECVILYARFQMAQWMLWTLAVSF